MATLPTAYLAAVRSSEETELFLGFSWRHRDRMLGFPIPIVLPFHLTEADAMLTSYLVKCPHTGCDWSGSLLPSRNQDAWRGSVPTAAVAVFECPACQGEWRARIVGDDVVPLPLDQMEPTLVQ